MAEIRIGTSGWVYPPWRGTFYPPGLVQRKELGYLASRLNSAEVNGSFYSLQRPSRYRAWFHQTPEDFLFAIKGSRFITHMKQLRGAETAMANFFASGVLALKHKLGPFLWQLPPRMRFDPQRLEAFFALLPRTTHEAARLADQHDDKLKEEAWTKPGRNRKIRHALEVRHPSFETEECVRLLKKNDIALVVADSAGTWPSMEEVTADLMYIRLHGDEELYASGYSAKTLDQWAEKIQYWHGSLNQDVYVYFDNDIKVKAPGDAISLARRLGVEMAAPDRAP